MQISHVSALTNYVPSNKEVCKSYLPFQAMKGLIELPPILHG